MRGARQVAAIHHELDHGAGAEPHAMPRTPRVVQVVHVCGRIVAPVRRTSGRRAIENDRAGSRNDVPSVIAEVWPDAARRGKRVLNGPCRIAPHPESPIDVFLPESLVRIGDVAIRLGVVIGPGRADGLPPTSAGMLL